MAEEPQKRFETFTDDFGNEWYDREQVDTEIERLTAALRDLRYRSPLTALDVERICEQALRRSWDYPRSSPVETEPPLPREIWACVSKGISPPYIRFFSSKAEMEAYEWRDTSVSPNCMRVAGPEASGEATGPEGDDSNMGTAPTSGPEATSSQGNAVETAGEQP